MDYVLDTSSCIALFPGYWNSTLSNLLHHQAQGSTVFVSTIALFELWYGVAKSKKPETNIHRFQRLLELRVLPLEYTVQDAEAAGRVRALLEAQKQPIGPYDTLIAGQALARGLTLITANRREFARMPGLL